MKEQSGKLVFGWIITITVGLIIAGVAIAMIFGENTDEIVNMIKQNQNTNTNNTVQTEVE